jgi:signal transduction histidine kinase
MTAQFKHTLADALRRYGFAIAVAALALLLSGLLAPQAGEVSFHGILLSAVAISAWYGGRGPGIVATLVAMLAARAQLQLALVLFEGLLLSALIGTLHTRLCKAGAALRARDDLLAIAAHEFKTPLTTVIGCTQTLQMRAAREGHMPRRDQDTLRVIAAQAKRLHALIDSVLDLAQLHNGRAQIARQAVDLAALAHRMAHDADLLAPRHSIEFRGPDSPVTIAGDRVRLEQVLQNLLDNAVKYSPEGGAITISVGQRNAEAMLTISDQGIGIPEDARAHLFQRFYRAGNVDRPRMQGTGIGLSVVTEIVALHGGVVEVDSVEGQGSTFTIRLPLHKDPGAAHSGAALRRRRPVASAPTAHDIERPIAKSYHEHVHKKTTPL